MTEADLSSREDTPPPQEETFKEVIIEDVPIPPGTIILSDYFKSQELEEQQNDDESAPGLPWSKLPDMVLVQIYKQLRDNDRLTMSQVCKSWCNIFRTPCLWRRRKFRFGGVRTNRNEHERAIGYARVHGAHLRQLTIMCEHPSYVTCKRVQKTMQTFWALLGSRHTRLETLIICQLYVDRYWRYDWARERFVGSLARFLRQQRRLLIFDMSEAMLPISNAFKILESLGTGSGRSLCVLNIEDFFHARSAVFRVPRYQLILCNFKALRSFYTNYNCLSDEILQILAKSCAGSLHYLSIKVYKHDPHFHRIENMSWRTLRRACPVLRVSMYFEGIGKCEEIASTATREIPLRNLQIWTGVHNHDVTWDLDNLLRYLGDSFGKTLEETSLGLENGREVIDEGLLYMLEKCKRLEFFDLQAVVMVPTIEEIYRLQEEYKIGLLRCHINAENLTGVEMNDLDDVNEKYRSLVSERAVDFRMTANEMPYL